MMISLKLLYLYIGIESCEKTKTKNEKMHNYLTYLPRPNTQINS